MRLLGVLLLWGCGPGPSFTGVWSGGLTNTSVCGGRTETTSGNAQWVIAERDDLITIAPDGNCGVFVADVTGDVASLRFHPCSATFAFTKGVFRLRSYELLDVDMFAEDKSINCAGRMAGVLRLE